MENEAVLLKRYSAESDPDAFRALVDRYQHMVFAVCARMLGSRADAEDAAQVCFLRMARHAGRLKAPIAGWLHRVAVTVCIDRLRAGRARRHREKVAAERRLAEEKEPSWENVKADVDEAVAALPERLRAPLVLYYLEGWKQEDVAAELGISQSAVSQRLKRAVASVRKRLKKRGVRVSAGVLGPLMLANARRTAPASLSNALGKMAVAGLQGGGVAGGAAIPSGVVVVVGLALVAAICAGLLLRSPDRPEPPPRHGFIPPEPEAPPPAPAPRAPAPAPTPAREPVPPQPTAGVHSVTVGGDLSGKGMFVDLDTGETLSLPARVSDPDAMRTWMRESGADVLYSRAIDPNCLVGADLTVLRVASAALEDAEPGSFPVGGLPAEGGPAFPVRMQIRDRSAATYVFVTREGSRGVLQLPTETPPAGEGAALRYVLFRSD